VKAEIKLATEMYNAIEDTDVSPETFKQDLLDETVADHCRIAARVALRRFGGEARDARVAERFSNTHKLQLRALAAHLMAERIKLERRLEETGSSTEAVADLKAVIYNVYDFAKMVTA
jgi:hypothetical protein